MNNLNKAVEQVESGGNPDAVSPKGAVGSMQTMPKTLLDPGYGVTPAKDNSPEELKRVGQDYLGAMMREFGNLDHALVAYNWGPGNASEWVNAGGNIDDLPKETRDYLHKVKTELANGDAARA